MNQNSFFSSMDPEIKHQFFIEHFFTKKLGEGEKPFYFPMTEHISLLFPLKGSLLLSSPSNDITLQKEHAILLPSNISYEITPLENTTFFYVVFSGTLATSLLKNTLKNGNFFIGTDYFTIKKDLVQLSSLLSSKSPNIDDLSILSFSLLMHLSGHTVLQEEPLYPPVIASAIQIMEENYTYLYGIEDLATQLEMSKNHLIRLFHEYVGISPLQYLTSIKIRNAKLLLESGESSLELIAVSCGFSGSDYFRKVFKKETGLSPRQFQKQSPSIKKTQLPNEMFL